MSKDLAQNSYKADLRELKFLLFEQFKLGELLGKAPFENWGQDEVTMILEESYKFSCDVLGPLNKIGDQGCKLEDGKVITPPGFIDAWKKLYEAGWKAVAVDPEYDGQGAPHALQVCVEEFLSGANVAFGMYPGLALGAAEVIEEFGTHAQKELYLKRMYHGTWGGTMCLTEPQAGSDVGAAKSTAHKLPNGKYSIKGTKLFISGGDHDLAENIIHLVLARVDNAPPGTKGLSLFIVPKLKINDDGSSGGSNDVAVAGIEHKMGINGSSTALLSFGEADGCEGELVGTVENQGIAQMFKMMNGARIGVGLQSVSVASTAYLNALEYAKERKQGASIKFWKDATAPRVAIIEHPDVRRMLLDMKSRVEGLRALIVKLARHQDAVEVFKGKDDAAAAYHQGQVDLLVPLVKAYGSDQAFRVCETAIQTYGGVGYTQDYPVEQYCRDSKIFSIYEGTNHIQAMDLVGRKLGQNGGANLQGFLGDVARFIGENQDHPVIGAWVKELQGAQEAVGGSAMRLLGWFQMGQMAMVPLAANRFLEMMSELAVGWLLLEGAKIAHDAQAKLPEGDAGARDRAFYEGKKQAAKYYALNVVPGVKLKAELLAREDTSPLDISDDAFGSF
ncbi:MAG: acyl-CoA dehydrogenase [Deltaproteobacteria bacterium]|nr:acyl-CoA dehydrogenase [Deltaproteobacteria bacterium]